MFKSKLKFPVFHFPEKVFPTAGSIQGTCQCPFFVPFSRTCARQDPQHALSVTQHPCSFCSFVFSCLPQFANWFFQPSKEPNFVQMKIFLGISFFLYIRSIRPPLWFFTIASPCIVSPAAFGLVWPVCTTVFLKIVFLEDLSLWGILLPSLSYGKDGESSMSVLLLPSILHSN